MGHPVDLSPVVTVQIACKDLRFNLYGAECAVRGRGAQEVAALPPLPLLRHLPPQLRQRDHDEEGRQGGGSVLCDAVYGRRVASPHNLARGVEAQSWGSYL